MSAHPALVAAALQAAPCAALLSDVSVDSHTGIMRLMYENVLLNRCNPLRSGQACWLMG